MGNPSFALIRLSDAGNRRIWLISAAGRPGGRTGVFLEFDSTEIKLICYTCVWLEESAMFSKQPDTSIRIALQITFS